MPTHVRVAIVLLAQALFPSSLYGENADWTLTPAELARLGDGGVLVDGEVGSDHQSGDVRAAVQIHASPEQVFRTLIDCHEALRFVPHLRHCAVLDAAPDNSWQIVEQQIDYGWFAPRAYYVFRADYEPFVRIRFSNVRGDFRENRGMWEFHPTADGKSTIVTYRLRLVPRFYVPRWVMRMTLKRDLPELMKGLRTAAEVAPGGSTGPSAGQQAP
ncbi:MAG TPA: SRPBCC family protein [Steroidobacteraceae bacterium]|nr:SRPBCC family protein [Steroidobacteraceae bacterium]